MLYEYITMHGQQNFKLIGKFTLPPPLSLSFSLSLSLSLSIYIYIYTGCPRRNGQNFGRVFLMLNYTDITQNTYIQS